ATPDQRLAGDGHGSRLTEQQVLAGREVQRRTGVLQAGDFARAAGRRVDVARPRGPHRPALAGLAALTALALRAGRALRAGDALRALGPLRAGEALRAGD